MKIEKKTRIAATFTAMLVAGIVLIPAAQAGPPIEYTGVKDIIDGAKQCVGHGLSVRMDSGFDPNQGAIHLNPDREKLTAAIFQPDSESGEDWWVMWGLTSLANECKGAVYDDGLGAGVGKLNPFLRAKAQELIDFSCPGFPPEACLALDDIFGP